MPGAANPKAGSPVPNSLKSILIACAAPALVLLAVVVPFLRFHEYNLLQPESLLLMAGAAAAGGTVGALSRFRPETLGPALTVVMLGVYLLYCPKLLGTLIHASDWVAGDTGNVGMALGGFSAVLFLTACVVCWLLRRNLDLIVATVFGTIVLSSIALPTTAGGEAVRTGALPAKLNTELPPLIHIVLDEHVGLTAMPQEIPASATAAKRIETTYEDFALYSRAYSRFELTHNALASLMNTSSGADVSALLDVHEYGFTLRKNEWFELLRKRGYAIKVYDTPWFDLCGGYDSENACYTYPLHSPNPLQRSTLSTSERLRFLLGALNIGKGHTLPSPLAASETLAHFQSDLAAAPRGVAYFVHLLLPHYDYVYKNDCLPGDPDFWQTQPGHDEIPSSKEARQVAYTLYMDQVICTDRLMRALFDQMKALGIYDEATIIVHGDHGSRIGEHSARGPVEALTDRDLLDYFATLMAFKAPGIQPGIRPEPILLQQAFGELFLGRAPAATDTNVMIARSDGSFATRTLTWPDLSPELEPQGLAARQDLRPAVR
jgi:hypothetical protein